MKQNIHISSFLLIMFVNLVYLNDYSVKDTGIFSNNQSLDKTEFDLPPPSVTTD